MNLKNAIQTVNVELKKIKNDVTNWHAEQDKLFKELKTVWQLEYNRKLTDKELSNVVSYFKSFEKFNDKLLETYSKKILSINTLYYSKIKIIPKSLSELASPYLKTVKGDSFGVGVNAQIAVKEVLTDWIANVCYQEFNAEPLSTQLSKKLSSITKDLNQTVSGEADHLKYMAKVDLFTSKMLESFKPSFVLTKISRKNIESNTLTAPMLYELEIKSLYSKVNLALDEIQNIPNSKLNALIKTYGKSANDESLARSKLAMTGVKATFSNFNLDFKDSFLEDMDSSGMNSMYLNDMLDHLNLGKSCLIDNCALMEQASNMDTASRELISDSLYDYLNSDTFFDKIKDQKKAKKKLKP